MYLSAYFVGMHKTGACNMNTLYERIEQLCQEHGITPGKLCSEINIRRSVLSDLKAGRKKGLSFDTLSRIANYFQIPLDSLQEGHTFDLSKVIAAVTYVSEHEKAPALTKKDKRDIARDLERIVSDLENGGDMMFDGDPMTPEARESIVAAMRLGLEAAKAKNKERFTPHKYRKD